MNPILLAIGKADVNRRATGLGVGPEPDLDAIVSFDHASLPFGPRDRRTSARRILKRPNGKAVNDQLKDRVQQISMTSAVGASGRVVLVAVE
jgi:hypothetical protein